MKANGNLALCHHGMTCPRIVHGDCLQTWRVAVNILKKQTRTADKR
jgi:hypothetical protein